MIELEKQTGNKDTKQIINFDNLTFYFADRHVSHQIDHLIGYDAIIIEGTDADHAKRFLSLFRAHSNQEFYLKPLFFYNLSDTQDPYLKELSDGIVFNLDNLKEPAQITREIFLRSTQLDFHIPAAYEAQMIKKILNYQFTRDKKELHPVPSLLSSIGYVYPILSVNFSLKEEWQVLEILSLAEKDGLFVSEFAERIYLCNHCSNGFLSYREVCPHCNSSNSSSEDLIHHFPCAYLAPISDFKNEIDHQMHCPKCNKVLRHIGVDYDKPSVIHHCKTCSQTYQDFSVKAKCLSCLSDTDVQYLVPKVIKSYTLSKKGEVSAVNGYLSSAKEFDLVFGTVSLPVFKTIMQYEIERVKLTENPSFLGMINLGNVFQLYQKIGNREQKTFLTDFSRLVREKIRTVDVISFESSSNLMFLFPAISAEEAQLCLSDICEALKKLVGNHFNGFDIEAVHHLRTLGTFTSPDTQLKFLLQSLFD